MGPSVCTENWFLSPRGGMCFWQGGPGPRCSGGLEDFQTPIAQRVCPCRVEETTTMVASEAMQMLDVVGVLSRQRLREPLKIPADVVAQGGWHHASLTVRHVELAQPDVSECCSRFQLPMCCAVTTMRL